MPKRSAGILLYRDRDGVLEVLLVHPGGPYWKNKDEGAWTLPKGEYEDDEDPWVAARREFEEETGSTVVGDPIDLGEVRQKSGKRVRGFAIEGEFDVENLESNTFELEWPPKSGRMQSFPEVDRAQWFDIAEARRRILAAQASLLDRLAERIGG